VLAAGVHSLSVNYQPYTIVISSIEVLLFPKKLVFRGGKKRRQTDKLFCNFWLRDGSYELQMCLAVCAGYLFLQL